MLDRQSVENCIQFLNRCDIKGGEVPAFVDLTNRLHHLRNAHLAAESAPPPPAESPTPE